MRHDELLGPGDPNPGCDGRLVPAGEALAVVLCLRCLTSARISGFTEDVVVAAHWNRPGRWMPRRGRRGK